MTYLVFREQEVGCGLSFLDMKYLWEVLLANAQDLWGYD